MLMSATVFEWDMFRGGVGHASMYINGKSGVIYISFWPQHHSVAAGLLSKGKIHFMNADKKADGVPSWASRPLNDLNEAAIINWWRGIQSDPFIDYKNKKPFQTSSDDAANFQQANNRVYNILLNQCSTTVVTALVIGAAPETRAKILRWLALNAGRGLGPVQVPGFIPYRVPTVTPTDVKNLVIDVWGGDWERRQAIRL
jgi:hypothetical protein